MRRSVDDRAGLPRRCLAAAAAACAAWCASCAPTEPLRLGIALGSDGIVAAQLAAEEVAAAGGIDGRPLELVILEDAHGSSARAAIAAAESLSANASVLAVVGHSNSGASLAASQVYNARGLPQVAPTSTAPLYSQAGPYSFRLVPDDEHQADFLVEQIPKLAPGPAVAVLYVNDDYGRALQAAVTERLPRTGVRVVYEAPYLEGGDTSHLTSAARAALAADPDLVLWLGRSPELLRFLSTLRAALPDVPILGSDGVQAAPLTTNPGGAFKGMWFVRFTDPDGAGPRMREFRRRYQERAGRHMSDQAVLAYDAVMLVVEALSSGARSRNAVRRYLASVGRTRPAFEGLGGTTAFDENGDATRMHMLAEVTADGVRPAHRR